ncbi:MAG TPA: response regulator [Actinomycetota bacterium]|nr:response regulator [Actinomycetota bacterium]
MERIRVLIADDEAAVREAVADLVSSDPDMEVAATAKDADEAIALARQVRPDVALIDVKMPGGGGPRAAKEIRDVSPQTHVVALSAYEDRRTVLEMLRAGVVGYVVKGTAAEEILYTIRRSMRGQGSLSVEVTADVIHELASLLERSEGLARELQELNRTKSELIQILSHELFTPITTIQGFAMTVAEHGDRLSREEIGALAAGVARASDRIRRLVGNLAAAARLDREGVELSTRPVPVGAVVERALAEFPRDRARIRLPEGDAWSAARVWADVELAARALAVVLENALAFSPEEAPVELGVSVRAGELELSVADRGPGVPEEMRERVFEAFTQADSSTTRTHEGLGIGLFLARRIMRAHGGTIGIRDREGGGTVLALSFPALEEREPEPAQDRASAHG